MNFLVFKEKMFDLACFNIHQVYAWQPDFDRNNLTRWLKKGYLIRLRRGFFSFPEYQNKPDYSFYFANRIYQPSYISLHSALAFYGMIPESVIQITSVSSLKTFSVVNDFGEFTYKNVKEALMFGYDLKNVADNRTILFATPEKALLDLLYLYPFYNTSSELEELRLDEDFLHEEFKKEVLLNYASKIKSKSVDARIKLFLKTYDL